jgi:hypothetical protein
VSRSSRRARRRARQRLCARALAAGAGAAALTLAIVVPLGLAGAGAGNGGGHRPVRHARVAVDPSLVAASDRVQEGRWARAVFDRAAFERAANEKARRDSVWDAIAACETQGNWSMRGPSFSGGVGFSNAAWDSFGGREFAPNAGMATREQQIVVAERIRAAAGYGAWGCAKRVGLS